MRKPIRVLQVLHILNRGGAEAMVMNLYRKIDRTRIQFDFLVHEQEKGVYEDEITRMGGKIYRIHAFKGYNAISYYGECLIFFKNHPEIKIVHGHLGSCAYFYLKAAKKYGKFVIAHSHSASKIRTFYDLTYKIFSFPTRYVADFFFGCSTLAGLARYGRSVVNSNKYLNFNNAIDTKEYRFNKERRDILRKEFDLSDDQILIGTVGRITLQKNPKRIFSIFLFLIENYKNVECLWVGTGELEAEIRSLIEKYNLQDKIIMTGLRSDIPDIVSAMDCMLFPSLWEGLPVSVIEAQAANLPVVLADTISKETQISDLLSWHSLEEDDSAWAADVMKQAVKYRYHRDRYAADMNLSGYDINNTVKDLMDFYENKLTNL